MNVVELALAGIAGGAVVTSWAAVALGHGGRMRSARVRAERGRAALTELAGHVLELESVGAILAAAGETAGRVFGATRTLAFEPGGESGWEARDNAGGPLGPAPPGAQSAFGWFRHNPFIAAAVDLGGPRFGAMRTPLREVLDRFDVDVLVPLVQGDKLLGVFAIRLGRAPDALERELLRLLRLELTAACANVTLHREAANVLTLAKELDLASAVKLALAPDEAEGAVGPLEWAGDHEAVGDAGSDFWAVYPLGTSSVMVVVGDAVGGGLGGTMVAAVVKSCCDAVFDGQPDAVPPAELLAVLNAALYRPGARPAHASCFAALFDLGERRVTYASAGHPAPYRVRFDGERAGVGVLAGVGPLLGDSAEIRFRESRTQLGEREVFLFHTDGLVKARDHAGEAFGDRRLQRVLAEQAVPTPREVRAGIRAALADHRRGAPLVDDMAMVLVRVS